MIPRRTNIIGDPVETSTLARAPAVNPIEWNAEQVAELTQLWASGMSATEIARRMGITKNAVVGKARRLELPMRRMPQEKAPPAPMLIAEDDERIFPPFPPRGGCLFPEGSGADITFCGAKQVPGRPYCSECCRKAYVKARDYTPEEKEAHRIRGMKIKAAHERAAKERAAAE